MCKLCVHGIQSIERARCIAFAHVSNCVLTGSKSTIEKHSGQGTKVSRYITSDPNVPYTVQQTLACAPFYRCCRAGSNQCHICRRSACKTVSPSAMHNAEASEQSVRVLGVALVDAVMPEQRRVLVADELHAAGSSSVRACEYILRVLGKPTNTRKQTQHANATTVTGNEQVSSRIRRRWARLWVARRSLCRTLRPSCGSPADSRAARRRSCTKRAHVHISVLVAWE